MTITIDNLGTSKYLNLRGITCPKNFIQLSLFIEALEVNEIFLVDIDRGEPEDNIIQGLESAGHQFEMISINTEWIRLKVACEKS